MTNINQKIGDKIKEARLERKFSRERIARRIGITQQAIEKYEKGKVNLTLQRLEEIALILNKDINFFIQN